MKKYKFIKDHISGIKKGSVLSLTIEHGSRLEREGYAEMVKEKKTTKRVVKKAPNNKADNTDIKTK